MKNSKMPHSNANIKVRESNFELLRIISMFMVVSAHFFYYSKIKTDQLTGVLSNFIYYFGRSFGQIGVTLFVMISAYFLCQKKFNFRSYLKLILQTLFYCTSICIIIPIIKIFVLKTEPFTFLAFTHLFSYLDHWFIISYIVFYITFPFFNIIVNRINKSQLLFITCFCVITLFIIGTLLNKHISDNFAINNLFWWIIIYFSASYIKIYPEDFKSILIPILIILLSLIFLYINYKYNFTCRSDFYIYFFSLSIFLLFSKIKLGHLKIINIVSSTMFGVYLLHDYVFIFRDLFNFGQYTNNKYFALISIAIIISIIFIGFIIDIIRQYILEKPLFKFLDKKLHKIYEKINNFFPFTEPTTIKYKPNYSLTNYILILYIEAIIAYLSKPRSVIIFICELIVSSLIIYLLKFKNK